MFIVPVASRRTRYRRWNIAVRSRFGFELFRLDIEGSRLFGLHLRGPRLLGIDA